MILVGPGSGKSNFLRRFLAAQRARGERLVAIDPLGDFCLGLLMRAVKS